MASTEQPPTGDAPVATGDVVAKLNMPTTPPNTGAEKPAASTADKGETKPVNSSDYDATEHLMSMQEVSAKYGVQFDLEHPGKSQGLSSSEVRTFAFESERLFRTTLVLGVVVSESARLGTSSWARVL